MRRIPIFTRFILALYRNDRTGRKVILAVEIRSWVSLRDGDQPRPRIWTEV